MGLFNKSKNAAGSACTAVQTSSLSMHPFGRLNSSVSLNHGSYIYAMLRQSVPIIDVAISKIVRLCSGFKFETGSENLNEQMNDFFENISVGGNQQGINMFVSAYLEQLLTYGSAVGEMLADDNGFYALYNGELNALEARRAQNNFDIEFYSGNKKLERQDLILFSALNPKPGEILGTSILQGLPFVADILLKIYNTIGQNWEHAGNLRYAVTYKPEKEGIDGATAKERAKQIAGAWSEAMGSKDIQFETVEDAVIAVGETSVDVTARAIETGRRFNVLPDKVDTIVNPPKYISGVVNNTAFAGGTDDETDESLRDRVLEIYKWENNALNEAAVKKMVLSCDDVLDANIVFVNKYLRIIVKTPFGTVNSSMRKRILDKLSFINMFNLNTVFTAAKAKTFSVKADIKAYSGADFDEIKRAAQKKISDFCVSGKIGRELRSYDIAMALSDLPFVQDINITLTPSSGGNVSCGSSSYLELDELQVNVYD